MSFSSAFPRDTRLSSRAEKIYEKYGQDHEVSKLLLDIAHYNTRNGEPRVDGNNGRVEEQPNQKKRKLAAEPTQETNTIQNINDPLITFACNDVSFSVPVRKKLRVELVESAGRSAPGHVRATDTKTGEVEYDINAETIDQVFCLPVPDKAQRQHNFLIVPKKDKTAESREISVFTVNDAPDKTGSIGARSTAPEEAETIVHVVTNELTAFLAREKKRLIKPDEKEFASAIPQPHRKGEKAYHVKAFRGSKEGYLYFLSTGILFGFKKPVLFFPFSDVESISYTSVLQRTFNLVITPLSEDGTAGDDIEFSMLDQADFAGIDAYIKAHELNDASMAADRRAKMYNVNKEQKTDDNANENGEAEPDDGRTELEKAEQQLQDEEDELEEDYEDSGHDSDGSGEDSEEDEGYADGDGEQDAEMEALDEEEQD